MNIETAINILEIEDIFNETDDTLKRQYRKLMLKYHPDSSTGNSEKAQDVIEAYNLLKESLPKIRINIQKDVTKPNLGLSLDKLMKIYSGETLKSRTTDIELSQDKLLKYNIFVLTNVEIIHNNISKSFNNVELFNIQRNYSINTEINVDDIKDDDEVTIKAYDKEYTLRVKEHELLLKCQLQNGVRLNILVTKKIRKDE